MNLSRPQTTMFILQDGTVEKCHRDPLWLAESILEGSMRLVKVNTSQSLTKDWTLSTIRSYLWKSFYMAKAYRLCMHPYETLHSLSSVNRMINTLCYLILVTSAQAMCHADSLGPSRARLQTIVRMSRTANFRGNCTNTVGRDRMHSNESPWSCGRLGF